MAQVPAERAAHAGLPVGIVRPGRLALSVLAIGVAIAAVAAHTNHSMEQVVRGQLSTALHAPHDAAITGLTLWCDAAARGADAAARDPAVVPLFEACLRERRCDATAIDAELSPYARAAGFSNYRLVTAAGEVRAAGPLRALTPLSSELRRRIAPLRAGHARVLPLFLDAGVPALLVAAVLTDAPLARLGTLLFELPIDGISRVLRSARAGESFETYAIDSAGRMVSDSRFKPQLVAAGLLPEGAPNTVMRVDVRDPGGDLTDGFHAETARADQPLTRMAASAVAGQRGIDLDGYRDYRGVPVVGVWRWLPQLGIAVATEIDVHEGFRPLHALQRLFAILLGALALVALALLAAMLLAAQLRARARTAETLAARYGQYRVVRKIGEGGMGVVYLATHELLRRPAAIKLLRANIVTPRATTLFEREVRITSTLTHPNTVAIYDYGRAEDGTLYYAMEYLEGLDLQRLVARFGPLPPARVLCFLRQLCGSLAEAHAAGVVHRDIKPANLFVCTRGGMADTLKVLDFGVVHVARGERMRLSQDKDLVGTPQYMAPELFESKNQASVQSDLYAVGAAAYYLLTGSPPFDGATSHALCLAHLTQQPEPLSKRLGTPLDPVLEQAILSCLAKQRHVRPTSAAGLRSLLERSALATSWTQADAEAWWSTRRPELESLSPADEDDPASQLREIRTASIV
jgi:eukaryotic-like serine/threonine-protein kinase